MEVLYVDNFDLRQNHLTAHLRNSGISVHSLLLSHVEGDIIADTIYEMEDLLKMETSNLATRNIVNASLESSLEAIDNDRSWIMERTVAPFIAQHGGLDSHVLIINCISAQRLDIFRLLSKNQRCLLISCKNPFKTLERMRRTLRLGIISQLPDTIPFDYDDSYVMERASVIAKKILDGTTLSDTEQIRFSSM